MPCVKNVKVLRSKEHIASHTITYPKTYDYSLFDTVVVRISDYQLVVYYGNHPNTDFFVALYRKSCEYPNTRCFIRQSSEYPIVRFDIVRQSSEHPILCYFIRQSSEYPIIRDLYSRPSDSSITK